MNTYVKVTLNSLSVASGAFFCTSLFRILQTQKRLRHHEDTLHMWSTVYVFFICVLLAVVEIGYDVMTNDVSTLVCVTVDTLLAGALTAVALLLLVLSCTRGVMTFVPHCVPSKRTLHFICATVTVIMSTLSISWTRSRVLRLSKCSEMPSEFYGRHTYTVVVLEIILAIAMAATYFLQYWGIYRSNMKARMGRLTLTQFIKKERRGLATCFTLFLLFFLARLPRFVVKVIIIQGTDVNVDEFRIGQILSRCSCIIIPLTTLLSRRYRPAFRKMMRNLLCRRTAQVTPLNISPISSPRFDQHVNRSHLEDPSVCVARLRGLHCTDTDQTEDLSREKSSFETKV